MIPLNKLLTMHGERAEREAFEKWIMTNGPFKLDRWFDYLIIRNNNKYGMASRIKEKIKDPN